MTQERGYARDANERAMREGSASAHRIIHAPMHWRWWSLAVRGLAAIGLGILTIVAPVTTFVSLVVLFGVFAIVDGVAALWAAAHWHAGGTIVARGLASLVCGGLALMWPGISTLALLFVIASWALIAGVAEIVMAVRHHDRIEHVGLLVLEGALSIAFGTVLFVSPLVGAIVLGLWVGGFAFALGVILLAAAWRARGDERRRPTGGLPHDDVVLVG